MFKFDQIHATGLNQIEFRRASWQATVVIPLFSRRCDDGINQVASGDVGCQGAYNEVSSFDHNDRQVRQVKQRIRVHPEMVQVILNPAFLTPANVFPGR